MAEENNNQAPEEAVAVEAPRHDLTLGCAAIEGKVIVKVELAGKIGFSTVTFAVPPQEAMRIARQFVDKANEAARQTLVVVPGMAPPRRLN